MTTMDMEVGMIFISVQGVQIKCLKKIEIAISDILFGSCKEPSKSLCDISVCVSVCLSSLLNYGSISLSLLMLIMLRKALKKQ